MHIGSAAVPRAHEWEQLVLSERIAFGIPHLAGILGQVSQRVSTRPIETCGASPRLPRPQRRWREVYLDRAAEGRAGYVVAGI